MVERAPESRELKSRWLAGEEKHPTERHVCKNQNGKPEWSTEELGAGKYQQRAKGQAERSGG